jgi:hypothetical protein
MTKRQSTLPQYMSLQGEVGFLRSVRNRLGNLINKIVFFPLTFLTKDRYINVDEE